METRTYTIAERPDLLRPGDHLVGLAWPEFMQHDPVGDVYWGRLYTDFLELQFVVCDEDGRLIASGNTIPLYWDGSAAGLPAGWDEVLALGVRGREQGVAPNTLSALAATIHPDYQGRGLSPLVVKTMRELAAQRGFGALIAPVRPNMKSRYPLTPIERYVEWKAEGETPFDPWLRVHWRLGARVLALAPASMVIPAPVADWENWTGMRFPESGTYIVPGALSPVEIDRENDRGLYVEPNVWMRHPLYSTAGV